MRWFTLWVLIFLVHVNSRSQWYMHATKKISNIYTLTCRHLYPYETYLCAPKLALLFFFLVHSIGSCMIGEPQVTKREKGLCEWHGLCIFSYIRKEKHQHSVGLTWKGCHHLMATSSSFYPLHKITHHIPLLF